MSPERPWNIESVLKLLAGLFICLSFGTLLTMAATSLAKELSPEQQKFLRSVCGTLFFQGSILVLAHYFLKGQGVTWRELMGWAGAGAGRAAVIAIVFAIVSLPAVLWLNSLSQLVITKLFGEPPLQPAIQVLEGAQAIRQQIVVAISTMILAPLSEEILFRGVLYRTVQQAGYRRVALVGTSLVFALIHGSAMTILPLTVLAMGFCVLYDRTGRLIAPVLAHSAFNCANFFLYLNRHELLKWWEGVKSQIG